MQKNILLLVLLPLLAMVSCDKTDVQEWLVGYWVSTDQSTETTNQGDTSSWTTNYKGMYYRLIFNEDGTYVMETDLQPDADNLLSQGHYLLLGDSLFLDNDYDCLVSKRSATSMVLDWTVRVQGCGIDNTYYEHFVLDKILPEK